MAGASRPVKRWKNLIICALPGEVEHLADKDSRQINMLEQIPIAKVFNFGGICSGLDYELELF